MKYTIFTNLRAVHFEAITNMRIDVGMIQIDHDAPTIGPSKRMELRGIQTGGLPTFSVFLDGEAPIKIESKNGGNFLLLSDSSDKPIPLDGGVILKVTTEHGQELVLHLVAEDYRNPKIHIREIEVESCPFDEDVDREILKHWLGSGYPRIEWVSASGYRALLEGKVALGEAEEWLESSRADRARLEGNSREE